MKNPGNLAAFAVLSRNNTILLVQRAYGSFDWALPGGTIEAGESVKQALSREILEEVSLSVPVCSAGVVFAVSYSLKEYSAAFLVDLPYGGDENPIPDPRELLDARFVPPTVALTMVTPINAHKLSFWLAWRASFCRPHLGLIEC